MVLILHMTLSLSVTFATPKRKVQKFRVPDYRPTVLLTVVPIFSIIIAVYSCIQKCVISSHVMRRERQITARFTHNSITVSPQ